MRTKPNDFAIFISAATARRKDKKMREKDLSAHELGYAYSVSTDQPATDWTRSVSQNILINRLKKGPERYATEILPL